MSADSFMMNQWYAATYAKDLGEEPASVEILGEKVVVFRTSGGVRAAKDLCMHRGSRISDGRIRNDRLVCPYHGWEYGSNGQCVHIPAHPEGKAIPTRARLGMYQCAEQDGIVWVSLGAPESPPPKVPAARKPGFRAIHNGPWYLETSFPRVIENLLDSTHLPFVHGGILGDVARPEVEDYEVHPREGGGLISDPVRMYQTNWDGSGKGGDVANVFEILSPWTMLFRKGEEGAQKIFWATVQPITESKSKLFLVAVQDTERPTEAESREFWDAVLAQDKTIIEKQRPELLPLDLQTELHLKSDRLHIAYRRWLSELGLKVGVA